jgi:hypothetical protein
VIQKLNVRLLQQRDDSIPLEDCWTKPPAYLAGILRGNGDSILSSLTSKRFSLTAKHEGEVVRHEETLTGGFDPPVVHFYQIGFLQLF